MSEHSETAVAEALATAVRDFGSQLTTEPRRVQGLMSDVLGAEARTRRAEIDAVIVAAEESVPEDLLAGRLGLDEGIARLRERGLGDDVARFAVDVWRYALGMLAAEAQPPTLTNSVENPASVSDPTTEDVDQVVPVAAAVPPVPPPAAAPSPPLVAPPEPQLLDPDELDIDGAKQTPGRNRWWFVGAGVAALAGLVVAIVVVAGGGDETTTADPTPRRPKPSAVAISFAEETTPVGTVTRTWTAEDGNVRGKVEIVNDTDAPVSGRHVEVVPKSLAATASAITSEPTHLVLQEDPVIAWNVELQPGERFTATYVVAVDGKVDRARLDAWKDERATAAAAFAATAATAPTLVITDPAEGATLAGDTYDVTGRTDPGATVDIGGTAVTVNADGTWTHRVTGVATIKVTATSPFGVTTSVQLNVRLPGPPPPPQPSTTTTTLRTKKCPNGAVILATATCPSSTPTTKTCPDGSVVAIAAPCPTTGGGNTTVTCWDGSTAPSQAACPPKPISVSVSGPTTVVTDGTCSFTFSLTATNFTPSSIDWPYGTVWDNKTTANFTFQQPTGSSYTSTISPVATAPDGRTASDSITVTVLPPPPFGFSC